MGQQAYDGNMSRHAVAFGNIRKTTVDTYLFVYVVHEKIMVKFISQSLKY